MGPQALVGQRHHTRGAPFIVRSSLVRQNQNRAANEVAVTHWLWSLPLWFVIALPAAVFGIGIGVVALVQIARIVAADMTSVLDL